MLKFVRFIFTILLFLLNKRSSSLMMVSFKNIVLYGYIFKYWIIEKGKSINESNCEPKLNLVIILDAVDRSVKQHEPSLKNHWDKAIVSTKSLIQQLPIGKKRVHLSLVVIENEEFKEIKSLSDYKSRVKSTLNELDKLEMEPMNETASLTLEAIHYAARVLLDEDLFNNRTGVKRVRELFNFLIESWFSNQSLF